MNTTSTRTPTKLKQHPPTIPTQSNQSTSPPSNHLSHAALKHPKHLTKLSSKRKPPQPKQNPTKITETHSGKHNYPQNQTSTIKRNTKTYPTHATSIDISQTIQSTTITGMHPTNSIPNYHTNKTTLTTHTVNTQYHNVRTQLAEQNHYLPQKSTCTTTQQE